MGLSSAYLHSLHHLPSLHVMSRHRFAKEPNNISFTEITITSLHNSSRQRTRKDLSSVRVLLSKGSGDWSEDSDLRQLDERRAPLSPNKEEILALFKRIQASISDGETLNSKKRNSKSDEDSGNNNNKPAAESILDVLRQPRTRGKGKTIGKKRDKVPHDSTKIEKREHRVSEASEGSGDLSDTSSKPLRPVSSFSRKSPIPGVSSPRSKIDQPKSSERDLVNEQQTTKYEEMKLAQLKEVAKSKGIKGYSKLKKGELVELLLRS